MNFFLSDRPEAEDVYWRRLDLSGARVAGAVQTCPVAVVAVGGGDPQPLRALLSGSGFPESAPEQAAVTVFLAEDYLDPLLSAHIGALAARGRPYVVMAPDGVVPWLGPFWREGLPCWNCFTRRLRLRRPERSYAARHGDVVKAPVGAAAGLSLALDALLLLELKRFAVEGECTRLAGSVWTLDTRTWALERHPLAPCTHRAGCHDTRAADAPAIVAPRPASMRNPTVAHPGQALRRSFERIRPHLDPVTGVLYDLQEIPTPYARGAFYVYHVRHPIVAEPESLVAFRLNLQGASSAIAMSRGDARKLALCEGTERFSAVAQDDLEVRMASVAELGEEGIGPAVLHGYSERQYRQRDETNEQQGYVAAFVPEVLEPGTAIAWVKARSLTYARERYVPRVSCYFGCDDDGRLFGLADSRGVAAGPTEAFCVWRGLLELVQTDAAAIWHANGLLVPRVDLDRLDDPALRRLQAVHGRLNRDLWVLDISMDVPGVHVCAAISRERASGNVVKGFGAHPSWKRAIRQAVLEACQMLPNVHDRDGSLRPGLPAPIAQPHLFPAPEWPARVPEPAASPAAGNPIERLVRSLDALGIEVLTHVHTRPEIGVPVVRVLAPGLCSWFDRRGHARLFDVPVRLGLRDTPLVESDLNDVCIEDSTVCIRPPVIAGLYTNA